MVCDCPETVDVINPADGSICCKVPLSRAVDLDAAVAHAQAAFPGWSGLTIKQRASIMFNFQGLINRHSEELADIIVRENGKNRVEALADIAKGNETTEWATSLPQCAAGKIVEVSRGITCTETRAALGVVAAVVPFNFPCMVPFWTIPIALTMVGCM